MVLEGEGKVELVSYGEYEHDEEVKKTYLNWLNDIDVVETIASPQLLFPKRKAFIESSFQRFCSPECVGFFIRHKDKNELLGTAKLDKLSLFHRSAEDGIMIGNKNYWNRGIGYQTYRILLQYAFETLGFYRITGGCNEHNTGMIKIFEKCGYKQEAILRKADLIRGERSDHYLYGILASDYFEIAKANHPSGSGNP